MVLLFVNVLRSSYILCILSVKNFPLTETRSTWPVKPPPTSNLKMPSLLRALCTFPVLFNVAFKMSLQVALNSNTFYSQKLAIRFRGGAFSSFPSICSSWQPDFSSSPHLLASQKTRSVGGGC